MCSGTCWCPVSYSPSILVHEIIQSARSLAHNGIPKGIGRTSRPWGLKISCQNSLDCILFYLRHGPLTPTDSGVQVPRPWSSPCCTSAPVSHCTHPLPGALGWSIESLPARYSYDFYTSDSVEDFGVSTIHCLPSSPSDTVTECPRKVLGFLSPVPTRTDSENSFLRR